MSRTSWGRIAGRVIEFVEDVVDDVVEKVEEKTESRAHAPHCDPSVLHAPGVCKYCDAYPDWQKMREVQRINFSDQHFDNLTPCPSEWFRSEEIRNRWGGNRPAGR